MGNSNHRKQEENNTDNDLTRMGHYFRKKQQILTPN